MAARSGGGASRRSQRKNSTLPAGPGNGLATTPAVPQPRSAAARATVATASARWVRSRTTPPAPSRSRPTSNCGLTIGSRSAAGSAPAVRTGGLGGGGERGGDQAQGDERQSGDPQGDRPADRLGRQLADVGPLVHEDPVV